MESESEYDSESQKTSIETQSPRKCQGCIEKQPNQLAHYGGCLPNLFSGENWEDI
jgi:hypothetical protein